MSNFHLFFFNLYELITRTPLVQAINKYNIPLHSLKTFLFLCCRRETQTHRSGRNTEEHKLSLPIFLPQIRDLQGQSCHLLPQPICPITPPPFLLNSFSLFLNSPAVQHSVVSLSFQKLPPNSSPTKLAVPCPAGTDGSRSSSWQCSQGCPSPQLSPGSGQDLQK